MAFRRRRRFAGRRPVRRARRRVTGMRIGYRM